MPFCEDRRLHLRVQIQRGLGLQAIDLSEEKVATPPGFEPGTLSLEG